MAAEEVTAQQGPGTLDPCAAAAGYAARGWRVFPLTGKVPLARTHGFKDATRDPAAIASWPEGVNVGIATGAGLVVLDVDHQHDGGETLHELERQHGALPRTASAETGGGGEHFYFTSRATIPCSAGVLGRGLDVRGDGGYVVAPPSVHPETGRRYEWDEHLDETPLAPLPAWLERKLAERGHNGRIRSVDEWRKLAADGARHGERNVRTAQLAGHLLARGVDPFVTLELVSAWDARRNTPPLGAAEVTRVVDSIARREAAKWMA